MDGGYFNSDLSDHAMGDYLTRFFALDQIYRLGDCHIFAECVVDPMLDEASHRGKNRRLPALAVNHCPFLVCMGMFGYFSYGHEITVVGDATLRPF